MLTVISVSAIGALVALLGYALIKDTLVSTMPPETANGQRILGSALIAVALIAFLSLLGL